MLMVIKKHTVWTNYRNKNNDNRMHTLRTKKRSCDCAQKYTHVDFIQPSAIYMEAQVNVRYQLRALLQDLVNERLNANTCNKPSTSFYRKYVVRQMIFGTHCITLKITHDMSDLT